MQSALGIHAVDCPMDTNRLLAAQILTAVIFGNEKTRDAMASAMPADASRLDRAFVMELVYGCTRNRILLEWLVGRLVRDAKSLPPATMVSLMLGLYQMRFTRVPAWAAIHETVEIEKAAAGIPRLVNGVLRSYQRRQRELAIPSLTRHPIEHISIATSHPRWLVERWAARLPLPEVLAMALANNEIPPLSLRVNTLLSSEQEVTSALTERSIPFTMSKYSPEGILLHGTPYPAIADLKGRIYVQDEAAQLIGHLVNPQEGDLILDACAAPGGKSTHLAQLTANRARIVALDKDPARVQILRENVLVQHAHSVEVREGDVGGFGNHMAFDRVLVDAPCSALGVIRRNPDVKFRHSPQAISEFGRTQLRVLTDSSRLLKSGGLIVYSVCTTEPEETVEVVERFLHNNRNFYIISVVHDISLPEPFLRTLKGLMEKTGYFFTYPHLHSTDGFFAARLGKR